MNRQQRARATSIAILTSVLALAIVVAIPKSRARDTAYPLDPGSPRDGGSRALVDAAARLGWTPRFGALSAPGAFDTAATYLVLGHANGESLSSVAVLSRTMVW